MAVRKLETRARALALQLLYAWDAPETADGGRKTADGTFARVLGLIRPTPKIEELALSLAGDVVKRKAELDGRIQEAAQRWRIERLGVVDRNVLRLAAGELTAGKTPPKVVIDEAVRLARWFGGEQSPSFVNGVLDRLARDAGAL
jgi:N utilization substance protein B